MNKIVGELVKIVRQLESDSIAERDFDSANKIRAKLINTFEEIESSVASIDANLSKFNASGLKAAFLDALKTGIFKNNFSSIHATAAFRRYYDRQGDDK